MPLPRCLGLILVALALLSPGTRAAAKATPALDASSKWVVNYDRNRCVLSRQFGPETDRAFVQFIRYGPTVDFVLNLIGNRFVAYDSRVRVGIRFGEAGSLVPAKALSGRVDRLPLLIVRARLDNAAAPSASGDTAVPVPTEAAVSTLHVDVEGHRTTLVLGAMDKPMAALRTCEDALVRLWGLDPAEQARLASFPQPLTPPTAWIQSGDYPRDSVALGEQATVAIRLLVGADGVPTECSVQSNIADNARFADISCRLLMRRARFAPARSAAGAAVASYYINQVTWIVQ